ncbi:MAG: ChbG/HpnK family deacetylase [Candidatus Margulisbacteria bacterium]|jgi:predicted glycoside hydrolase/deacetylase ChbG (UPF0249 family)|nr:ChbG/HpnK family deacetylase [Candidatus Margulisiibacteriota bacterium]
MNIIINADDFGISASANKAIAELYKKGVISSATLLVDLPDSKAAADLAKRDRIPVGLHFNLTLGSPSTPPGTCFKNRGDFERQLLKGQIKKKFIQDELARQYQKMLDFGLTPTHLDSHQHIHNWPQLFPLFARFARAKNIPLRLVLEKTIFNKYDPFDPADAKRLWRKFISLCFGRWNSLLARLLRVQTNRALTSVFALWPLPAELTGKHLRLILRQARHNTEYMCHPLAAADNTPTAITGISAQEYVLMTNPEFFAMIYNKFNLINFGGLNG